MNDFVELFNNITHKITTLFEIPESGSTFLLNYKIKGFIDTAEKALVYDPSGFTSMSHLENNWLSLIKDISFDLNKILNNDPKLLKFKKFGKEIKNLFSDKAYLDEKEYFITVVNDGLKHYGSDKDFSTTEIIDARYNSLNSFKYLSVHQFLRGEYDSTSPAYIKQIYEWWNINSLLKFAVTLPNSVSMHLIRNPNFFEMYFCFVIKNGSNIYIMTDKQEHKNPLFHSMTRRPDRDLARQIGKHTFPYYLMDVGSEDGELYTLKKEDLGNALAPYQKDTKIISTIDQLEESSLIWTILMFNLIQQNYFFNQVTLPSLSYTAEMIKKPDILIKHATNNGLTIHQEVKTFDLNTISSISTKNVDHKALGSEVSTNWIEERYGHLVDEQTLNLIAPIEDNYELNTESNSIELNPTASFRDNTHIKLFRTSSNAFGEVKKLEMDHVFLARKNYVSTIEALAYKEFLREEKAMDAWFSKLVKKNNDIVMDACKAVKSTYQLQKDSNGNLNYKRNTTFSSDSGLNFHTYEPIVHNNKDITDISLLGVREEVAQSHLRWWPKVIIGKQAGRYQDHECCISGKKAHYGIGFMFENIQQVIDFFNISIDDVPEFLRFFSTRDFRSRGNQILDRIDPMTNINNPFSRKQYKLSILVLFSKSELKKFGND